MLEQLIDIIDSLKAEEPIKRMCFVVKQTLYDYMVEEFKESCLNYPGPRGEEHLPASICGITIYVDDEYCEKFNNSNGLFVEESMYLLYFKSKQTNKSCILSKIEKIKRRI